MFQELFQLREYRPGDPNSAGTLEDRTHLGGTGGEKIRKTCELSGGSVSGFFCGEGKSAVDERISGTGGGGFHGACGSRVYALHCLV